MWLLNIVQLTIYKMRSFANLATQFSDATKSLRNKKRFKWRPREQWEQKWRIWLSTTNAYFQNSITTTTTSSSSPWPCCNKSKFDLSYCQTPYRPSKEWTSWQVLQWMRQSNIRYVILIKHNKIIDAITIAKILYKNQETAMAARRCK